MAEENAPGGARVPADAAAAKCLRVLRALAEPGIVRVSNVVAATGLNKATVIRILKVLEHEGFIVRDEQLRIRFGAEAFLLAASIARQPNLQSLARPCLARLAAATEDNVTLCTRTGLDVVCVEREEGTFPIRASYLVEGRRLPLGVGSPGIALIAALPDGEVEEILTSNRAQYQRFQRVDLGRIREEIRAARVHGYALSTNVVFEGTGGLSVVVPAVDGRPRAAITVAAIISRLVPRAAALASMLRKEADSLAALMAGPARRSGS